MLREILHHLVAGLRGCTGKGGLLAVTTIDRESKQKTAKGPRSDKEVDHGDPSCVAEDH